MPILNLLLMSATLYFIVRVVVRDRELNWWYCVMWILAASAVVFLGFFFLGPSQAGLSEAAAYLIGSLLGLATLLGILLHQGYGWRNAGIIMASLLVVQTAFSGIRWILGHA